MQRLFSTFADGWPGTGLLIQRLFVGGSVLYCATTATTSSIAVPHVIAAVSGVLLIAGLWTPLAGILTACSEAWVAVLSPMHPAIPAGLAVLGVSLALIGPGEWSVDARLYGRKHFILPEL